MAATLQIAQIFSASNYSFHFLTIPVLIVSVGVLAVAARTFLVEGVNRVSLLFSILSLSVFIWLFSDACMYSASNVDLARWFAKASYVGVPIVPAALYHFTVVVLGLCKKERKLVWLIWIISILSSSIIAGTDLVIGDAHKFPWGFGIRYAHSVWGGVHVTMFVGIYGLSLFRLWKAYNLESYESNRHQRLKLLLTAFSVGSLASIDYLSKFGIQVYPIGFFAVFLAIIVLATAIRKYHFVDITPRFAAESIIDTMDDALLVLDAEGIIRLINRSSVDLLALPDKELLGKQFSTIFGKDELFDAPSFIKREGFQHRELTYTHLDRGKLTISLSASPMKDEKGQLLAVVCIARDITYLKTAEAKLLEARDILEKKVEERTLDLQHSNEQLLREIQERKIAENALRKSEENYRMVVSSISSIVWRIEFDSSFQPCDVYFSPVTDELLGLPPGSVGNDLEKFFSFVHPDDLPSVRETLAYGVMHAGTLLSREYRIRRCDDELRWFRSTGIARRSESNTVQAFGTTEDVTDLKVLEQQLFEQQKLESIGLLAGGIAHDFNNLLTPIVAQAELIRMSTPPGDRIYSRASAVLEASSKAQALVRQLLSFSKKHIMSLERCDLNELVSTFMNILRSTIRENIEIRTDLSANPCQVRCDRSQIEQILLNLAVNAQDAIAGVGTIFIRTGHISLDEQFCRMHPGIRPGPHLIMTFSDTGSGIEEEIVPHIFEPFFTTKSVGSGTGLGLSTVYGIVKQHGGCVDVEGKIGFGTTFRIYLPEASCGVDKTVPCDTGSESRQSAPTTILLVEDNEMVRESVREILEAYGHKVLAAETPKTALSIATEQKARIDLLVTDVVMPQFSGPELHHRLREIIPGLKALYISGYTSDQTLRNQVPSEEFDFLLKPFTPDAIAGRISKLLEDRDSDNNCKKQG